VSDDSGIFAIERGGGCTASRRGARAREAGPGDESAGGCWGWGLVLAAGTATRTGC
jgi:hypothetical protein